MKSQHGAVIVHPTSYDGCVELASLQLGHMALGSSPIESHYKCSKEIVKSFLVQARIEILCFNTIRDWHFSKQFSKQVSKEYCKHLVALAGMEEQPNSDGLMHSPVQSPASVRGDAKGRGETCAQGLQG